MKALTLDDLIPLADYDRQRDAFRARLIALKQRRRISVGPSVTLVFENRDTLQFQIQEMARAESISDPEKLQDELDLYNQLLPSRDALSATLLIEITEAAKIKERLDSFMGLDRGETVAIVAGGERAYARFEGGHSHETKISAVHFVRFAPGPRMREAFADLRQPVTLEVHHGAYHAEASVPGSMREEWLADLST
jgi:hypothetical protein